MEIRPPNGSHHTLTSWHGKGAFEGPVLICVLRCSVSNTCLFSGLTGSFGTPKRA